MKVHIMGHACGLKIVLVLSLSTSDMGFETSETE